MIFIWYNNRNHRHSLHQQSGTISSPERCHGNFSRLADSFVMCLNSPFAILISIHLAGRISCCRIGMRTPMIQDLRNMINTVCFFAAAQNKIKILGSVVFFPKFSDFIYNFLIYHKNMANIIIASQQIPVEIRLEMGVKIFLSIHGHLIFICIDNLRLALTIQRLNNLIQSIDFQYIIMVAEHNILALCQF